MTDHSTAHKERSTTGGGMAWNEATLFVLQAMKHGGGGLGTRIHLLRLAPAHYLMLSCHVDFPPGYVHAAH